MERFDFVMPVGECSDDFKGAPFGDGEFGDAIVGGGAVYLDLGSDDVTLFVGDTLAALVYTVGGCEAAIFGEIAEDCGSKPRLGVAKTEKVVKVGYATMVGKDRWDGG